MVEQWLAQVVIIDLDEEPIDHAAQDERRGMEGAWFGNSCLSFEKTKATEVFTPEETDVGAAFHGFGHNQLSARTTI